MAQKLEPAFYKDFSSGVVSNVAQNLLPKNSVRLARNMDADKQIGALTTRLGTDIVGATLVADKSILGVHHHNPAQGTAKLLASVNDATPTNADIFDVGAGAISLADDTKNLPVNFMTYLGETLRLNGTDAPKAWNGSSWITTGGAFDLGDMPTGHRLAQSFLSRVYLAGKTTEPNRLEYSTVPTSGAISWNTPTDFIDIDAEDNNGDINALAKVPNYLLILKERSMHRWNFYNAFPEQLIDIGTLATKSVVQGHGLVAFFSASSEDTTGFYMTNGNRPVPISHDRVRTIEKFVKAISYMQYNVMPGWGTDRIFGWSVGDITVDGITYSNAVLRYNRILDQWTIRTYPFKFTCFAPYSSNIKGATTAIVGGTDKGYIIQLDKPATYTDYSGQKIPISVATHFDKFNYNQIKEISDKAIIDCDNLAKVTVEILTDKGISIVTGGTGSKVKSLIKELLWKNKIKGHKFSVIVRGEVMGAEGIIHEIELPSIVASIGY